MCEMSPEQRAAIAETIKATENAVGAMRSMSFPDVSPGIFGGSDVGQRLAASVNQANEHLRGMTAGLVDELEETLDVMFAEAVRLQAAAREASEGDER